MKAKLIVIGGTTSTTEVNLRLPTTIGRGRSAQVTIPHSLVSRQHCEISEFEGRLLVRDLESLNGTYVGDERITEAILEPGALLTVGTVTFRAVYEVGNDSVSDDLDAAGGAETLKADVTETQDANQVRVSGSEAFPADAGPCDKTRLPKEMEVTVASDASDDTATEPTPNLSTSLESTSQDLD